MFVCARAPRLDSGPHYDTLLLALVVYFYLDECALEIARQNKTRLRCNRYYTRSVFSFWPTGPPFFSSLLLFGLSLSRPMFDGSLIRAPKGWGIGKESVRGLIVNLESAVFLMVDIKTTRTEKVFLLYNESFIFDIARGALIAVPCRA